MYPKFIDSFGSVLRCFSPLKLKMFLVITFRMSFCTRFGFCVLLRLRLIFYSPISCLNIASAVFCTMPVALYYFSNVAKIFNKTNFYLVYSTYCVLNLEKGVYHSMVYVFGCEIN